ncbi:MAG: response regulator [Alphaproteobacteria bacterium]|nr:response regulator [Alphaproteobacteria bacterium]
MSLDRATLAIALDALKSSRELFENEDPQGLAALQRIARSVRDHAASQGMTDLAELAEEVQVASTRELDASVELLLNELRRELFKPQRQPGAVLVVAADPAERSTLARALAGLADRLYESDAAQHAWAVLQKEPVAGIVLDLSGDTEEGRVLIGRVRADPTLKYAPLVVLCNRGSSQLRAECLALGASEFFVKPCSDAHLAACLATLMGHDDRMLLELGTDPATGLPPAQALKKAARKLQHEAEVTRSTFVVALARITGLDALTRERGEAAATRVVRTVAETFVHGLPKAHVFTWQAQEMAILMPATKADPATRLLQDVLAHVAALRVPVQKGDPITPTVAVGGVEVLGMPFDRSIASAQRMLDLAEQAGAGMPVVTPLASAAPPRHRVLVVEDDHTVGEIVVRTLQRAGLDAVLREDGLTALELAKDLRFDMVITDIVMPFMDGYRLVENLRDIPRYKRTPILVLTSLTSERHVVQGFETGADAYITKPFNPRILAARVKSLLARNTG